jgi:DNA invertase Pin-like site-specific DNA recombinase
MALYGGMSMGERNRTKIRIRSAMATQAATEGRYLGGAPPYGYRLADAGPHPNPSRAVDGRRLHRLEPDPATWPVVKRIYRDYLAGSDLNAIVETLTADGILSPSARIRMRTHRPTTIAWSRRTVRLILRNPRYTGRQVWNRRRSCAGSCSAASANAACTAAGTTASPTTGACTRSNPGRPASATTRAASTSAKR